MESSRGLLNPLPKENNEAQREPEAPKVTQLESQLPASQLSLAGTFKAYQALSCPLQATVLPLGQRQAGLFVS